jgi:adenine-specific DNA-methyltransferase
MMRDRIAELSNFISEDGAIFVSIDKAERTMLEHNLDSVFGQENKVEELIWIQNTNDGRSSTYSTNHEYVEVYSKSKPAVEADFNMFREPKPGLEEVMAVVEEFKSSYPSVNEIQTAIRNLYRENKKKYRQEIEDEGLDWEIEKRNDPWKGLYNYNRAEYRDLKGRFVDEFEAKEKKAIIWVWREDNWTIMSADSKQSDTTKDPKNKNFRYYDPIHPITVSLVNSQVVVGKARNL